MHSASRGIGLASRCKAALNVVLVLSVHDCTVVTHTSKCGEPIITPHIHSLTLFTLFNMFLLQQMRFYARGGELMCSAKCCRMYNLGYAFFYA